MGSTSDDSSIADLVALVKAGDEAAASELVRRFEPLVRQRVRVGLRLRDERLRRVLDSINISQSVMASFFVGVMAGRYDLEQPGQLVALLTKMAGAKLAERAAEPRDVRPGDGPEVVSGVDGPDVGREPPEGPCRDSIAGRRSEGRPEAEVAAEGGGTGEARRERLARGLERVARRLGRDDDRDAHDRPPA